MTVRSLVLCLVFIMAAGVPAAAQELAPLAEPGPSEQAIRNEDMSPQAVALRYAGVYSVGPDHYVSIMDARDAGQAVDGGLLFYDHASDLMRPLHHFLGRIYTYGPSFDVHEPCAGSVTFLARDETTRILWLPEKPPAQLGWKLPLSQAEEHALHHGARIPSP